MRNVVKLLVCCVLPIVGICGCGGSTPKEVLVPVAGTLEVDGKPMGGVQITFIPANGKTGAGGVGLTGDTGAFTVTHTTQQEPGLPVGDYTISYSKLVMPDGSPLPKGSGNAADSAPQGLAMAKQFFPSSLVSPKGDSPQSKANVPAGGNSKLELKVNTKGLPR